jgi:hypothetical protein|tara:strand:- start:162 stop:458 length:297 start_codon:yes stop_codon:yes gene_type:complete
MRSLITAIFIISATSTGALAQSATPQQQQQPTCAQALPQIEQLKGQADELGIDTSTASNQIDAARQARQAGNNPQCMQALVAAQRDIMQRAEAKGLTQ